MNDSPVLPTSGFSVRGVYAVDQKCQIVQIDPDSEAREQREVSVSWDWRVVNEEVFEVRLQVDVGPTRDIPEFMTYAVVGAFGFVAGHERDVAVSDFVTVHAVATLMPFIREGLTNLSSRGAFEPYHLPMINTVRLAADFNYEESTGARQVAGGERVGNGV